MSDPELALPNRVEVKVALDADSTDRALAALRDEGLLQLPEARRIHFLDGADLQLFVCGLILRIRETQRGDNPDDATLKLRGASAPEAWSRFAHTDHAEVKFEGDKNIGRPEVSSFSITNDVDVGAIAAVLAGERALETLLAAESKTLFSEAAGIPWDALCLFGPIEATIWKLVIPGFQSKVTAELWQGESTRFLELSDKVGRTDVPLFEQRVEDFASKRQLKKLDSSKTRLALAGLSARPLSRSSAGMAMPRK